MAKILIIGAGVAGLSAGIYAQLSGHQAIVCEKHFIAGGNLTAWNRSGFHIDNCIHWLTGTNPASSTYAMWETLGALGAIEIYQGETLFTCEHDGKRISLYRDLLRMKNEMLALSPEDEKEILAFVETLGIIYMVLLVFIGMMVTHDYSISKNIVTTAGTIVAMVFIMFVTALFSTLLMKLVGFVSNIAIELKYRM